MISIFNYFEIHLLKNKSKATKYEEKKKKHQKVLRDNLFIY